MEKMDVAVVFDHHSAEFGDGPFTACEHLRRTNPVAWTPAHGGYWVVTGYENVVAAFRDFDVFSSAQGATIPDLSLGTSHIPITTDPPHHTAYRRLLTPWFTREAASRMESVTRELVGGLLDILVARGSFDFVEDFAAIVPGSVTLTMLGFPVEKQPRFHEAMRKALEQAGTTTAEEVAADREWIVGEITAGINARRTAPRDDLLTALVIAQFEKRTLTDAEIIDIFLILFIGGFHTTINALSNLLIDLDVDREHRQQLIDDPSKIPQAVEEIVRAFPPAMAMARTVIADTELGGVPMKVGDKVLLSIAAANRDPARFADPDAVDYSRQTSSSVAWGWGVHRCLGIHLARLILRIEVEMILERLPNYDVLRDRTERNPGAGISYGYRSIPAVAGT